jgi:TolB protein
MASATLPGTNGRIALARDGDIWTVKTDGTGAKRLTSGSAWDEEPVWGPYGGRLIFTRIYNLDAPWPRNEDLFIINADGTGLRRLVRNPAVDSTPIWSPDGKRFVFSSSRAGDIDNDDFGPEYQLYIRNVDGPNLTVRRVTPPEAYVWHYAEDFSPDGKRIAFTACDEDFCWVESIRPDGTDLRDLTDWTWFQHDDLGDGDYSASWGPYGRRILVGSNFWQPEPEFNQAGGIVAMNAADGTNRRVLLRQGNSKFQWLAHPVWSPDGKKIMFNEPDGIYVMNADGTGARFVTSGSSHSWQRLRP